MKINSKYLVLMAAAVMMTGCGGGHHKKVQNIVSVKTITPVSGEAVGGQGYPGTIEEVSGSSLSFAGAGTLKALYVKEGQNVRAGQLIGIIDATSNSNAVAVAHATTLQAQESLRQAQDAYRRMKMLHDNGSLPEIKWVDVETKLSQARQMVQQASASEKIARKGLTDTRLLAPFSGYISKKLAEVGQNVGPGIPVVQLVKIDQVKVKISVPDEEVSKLTIGQTVRFRVPSLGNRLYSGKVTEKNVAADPVSRQYEVKALVNNPDHKLLPGMVCDAYAENRTLGSGMALPADIIQIDTDSRPFVWTVVGGKARKAYVTLGENVGESVYIIGGLNPSDKVIVSGQQKVSNGTKVKEQ
ncbi:MAG: efflux RND transporter periplasmic adaptor subunit [Prevotella sp.]|jgi:RND family efflux transporter MFP subunit